MIVLREYMHRQTTNALKDGDLNHIYINEEGQIVFARLLFFRYSLYSFSVDMIQTGKVHSNVTFSHSIPLICLYITHPVKPTENHIF